MIPDDRDHQVTPFPTKLVGVTAVLTLAVLAWFSWSVYDAYKFVRDTNTRIVGLEQARGDIVHLDEVLTMSASMAAATGEAEWIDRYRSFEPKLEAAIKQAIDVAQRSDVANAIRETDAANVELVKMESEAFTLIHARRLEEARAILSGASYSDQKQLYAGGMEKLLRGLRAEREAAVELQRTATLGSMSAMGFVAVVIIVAWLIVLTRVREWRTATAKNVGDLVRAEQALRTSHDDLERRITDRTRELEDEIGERKQTEQELAESQEQLQALADYMQVALSSMSDGIFILDGDLNIVAFNQRYVDLLNLPEGLVREGGSIVDAVGFTAKRGDYKSWLDGDIDDVVASRLKQMKSNEEYSIEVITPTGRIVEYRSSPIKGGGRVSIMHDITERKRAEEKLQTAHGIIKDQKERMEDELNIGREIQMSMIPLKFPPFPDHDEFSLFATLKPAREVGGDFYDYYFIDEERLCFCIGDVSGKGVPAALFVAMAKTVIKSRAADDRSTASILTHVNDELSVDNDTCMFVTIFFGVLNIRTGELLYTNAGHNPPYLKRKDGALKRLDQRHGPFIGGVEGMVYAEGRDTMEPDDLLLLYTDGVTEAMDVEDRLFSENRLEQLLTSMDTDDVDKVVDNTVFAVKAFEGEAEQADDITLLALTFHGSPKDALIAERRIVIKNHLPEIAAVNEKFQIFAEEFGIPRSITLKIKLIFDELLNNVISHAYRDEGDHDIEMRIGLSGERLVVTITDDGVPFNPLSIAKPRTDLTLADREIGGMGIHLVQNLVDDVSYQRRIDKNVLSLVSHLQQNDSAA